MALNSKGRLHRISVNTLEMMVASMRAVTALIFMMTVQAGHEVQNNSKKGPEEDMNLANLSSQRLSSALALAGTGRFLTHFRLLLHDTSNQWDR